MAEFTSTIQLRLCINYENIKDSLSLKINVKRVLHILQCEIGQFQIIITELTVLRRMTGRK